MTSFASWLHYFLLLNIPQNRASNNRSIIGLLGSLNVTVYKTVKSSV